MEKGDLDYMESYGKIKVKCDSRFYGTDNMELDYELHPEYEEALFNELLFAQEHYMQLYESVLADIFEKYLKNPKLDVWDESTRSFLRVEFSKKEELHPYIGNPAIHIAQSETGIVFGLAFWKNNKLAVESGFCAVFSGERLLLMADDDFENILQYWEFYTGEIYTAG